MTYATFAVEPNFVQKLWSTVNSFSKLRPQSPLNTSLGLDALETSDQECFISGLKSQLAAIQLYQGPIDGCVSPALVQALERVQQYFGLPTTGKLDSAT
ncbi:MAG: peptidoglycan-binding domain-containing protein, partial [Prochlorothrix sp.]